MKQELKYDENNTEAYLGTTIVALSQALKIVIEEMALVKGTTIPRSMRASA
ncbi:hypothetical protein G3A39_42580 [Paraburkholderia aspalathi]|nr:hypothetical protein [Paraburkholderia aspalathi]